MDRSIKSKQGHLQILFIHLNICITNVIFQLSETNNFFQNICEQLLKGENKCEKHVSLCLPIVVENR